MNIIDMQPNRDINDNRIAFVTLVDMCRKVIANRDSYPKQIFHIARRYIYTIPISVYEYDYLVITLIDNPDYREELLKWQIMSWKLN